MAHGFSLEARQVLLKVRGFEPGSSAADGELAEITASVEHDRGGGELECGSLWREPGIRRALVLGCALQLLQQLAGINTLM